MARKKAEESAPPGAPLWMATFGDLMNLLLCFFVLLFSMSSINEEQYALVVASFSNTVSIFSGGEKAIGEGMLISSGVSQLTELDQYMNSMGKATEGSENVEEATSDAMSEVEAEKMAESEELAEKISESVNEQEIADEVDVSFTSQYVLLTMNGALLFESGSADLKTESYPVMDKVSLLLERYSESIIEVEGHTDNVPINSSQYADNNVLSSFRALSVFDYIIEHTNISPSMIKHSGRGEYVPIADNTTEEGRAKNRRVEIKIYHSLSSY